MLKKDIDVVLSFIKSLPDNEHLLFQLLTHKAVMLMALANADRCSDLAALDLRFRSFHGNGAKFIIPDLTKTRRNGSPAEAFYPLQALQCYEKRSKGLCSNPLGINRNPLFILVRKPHKPVKAATIGHWLNVMHSAGIDTNISQYIQHVVLLLPKLNQQGCQLQIFSRLPPGVLLPVTSTTDQ